MGIHPLVMAQARRHVASKMFFNKCLDSRKKNIYIITNPVTKIVPKMLGRFLLIPASFAAILV